MLEKNSKNVIEVWRTGLDLKVEGGEESRDDIVKINKTLADYHQAVSRKENTENQLHAIIEACEEYIKKIPPTKRMRYNIGESWENLLPEWPHLVEVLEIQKKAVAVAYLPKAETTAKARWNLLKELLVDEHSSKSKPLEKQYWGEYRFQGKAQIQNWINDKREYGRELMAFGEMLERNKQKKGINREEIIYFDKPDDYLVTIKNGSLYQGDKIFDSASSKGGTDINPGECIFVIGSNGKMYCNNPNEYLDQTIHHSSFLHGKPVMCAGSLHFNNRGEITEVTVLSGHYQPRQKQLLEFLSFLQKNHIDLSKINVIDQPGGVRKNALKYLSTRGVFLSDKEDLLLKVAHENFIKYDFKNCEAHLEKAIQLGSAKAKFYKALYLLQAPPLMYSNITGNERIEQAREILQKLKEDPSTPYMIFSQAKQRLKIMPKPSSDKAAYQRKRV